MSTKYPRLLGGKPLRMFNALFITLHGAAELAKATTGEPKNCLCKALVTFIEENFSINNDAEGKTDVPESIYIQVRALIQLSKKLGAVITANLPDSPQEKNVLFWQLVFTGNILREMIYMECTVPERYRVVPV